MIFDLAPTLNNPAGWGGETDFTELSPTWTGARVAVRVFMFALGGESEFAVVGWEDDPSGGHACPVHVVKAVEAGTGYSPDYLIYGGTAGLRILDDTAPVTEATAHLPRGYGWPLLWYSDADELPDEVRAVVEPGER